MKKYILNNEGEPIPESNLTKWADSFQKGNRQVALEDIGESKISTVFLGISHGVDSEGPILWETMVFGGPMDEYQERCSGSRKQALAMHNSVIEKVKESRS